MSRKLVMRICFFLRETSLGVRSKLGLGFCGIGVVGETLRSIMTHASGGDDLLVENQGERARCGKCEEGELRRLI